MKKFIPIIIVLFAVVLAISCIMIFKDTAQTDKEKSAFDQLSGLVSGSDNPSDSMNLEDGGDDSKLKDDTAEKLEHKRDLKPLFAENSDCIGWIFIEGTEVDYPVMHTPSEPQKYLRRNFDGEDSTGGVPFLQENTTLTEGHLIIYGHNMRNGSMFADIAKYDELEYCDAHPTIEFETADGVRYYDVYAVALVDKYDEWYGFVTGDSEEVFDTAVTTVTGKALYQTEVVPEYGKQILTLSTCYGDNDDDRIVVIGIAR